MKQIILCIIVLMSPYTAFSAEVTYADLKEKLLKHPSLESLKQRVIAQTDDETVASALPDPMIMLGLNNYPADGNGGFDRFAMTSKSLGVIQKIPNKKSRKASVLEKKILTQKSALSVQAHTRYLEASLNTYLAELARIQKHQTLLHTEQKLLKQEIAYWSGRLSSGENALSNHSNALAEYATLNTRLAGIDAEKTSVEAGIIHLVGDVYTLEPHVENLIAWPNNIDIYPVLLAQKDIQQAEARLKQAEADFGLNYQIGMTYAQRENSGNFDGGDFVSAQVGFTIPLWAHKRQEPKRKSAQAYLASAKAEAHNTERLWKKKLTEAYANIQQTLAEQKALTQQRKALEVSLKSVRHTYQSTGGLTQLIQAKRQIIHTQLEAERLKAQYVRQISFFNANFKTEGTAL